MLMPQGRGDHRATDAAQEGRVESRRRKHWFWVADVTLEELEEAEEQGLDEEEIIERFGGMFP